MRGERQKRVVRAAVLSASVDVLLAAHVHSEARDAADELTAIADALPTPCFHALAEQARGGVLLADGDPRAALDRLRDAWAEWQALDVPYEAARVRVAMGLCWRQIGDTEAAELELDAARRVFVRLGAAPDVARVDEYLARPEEQRGPLTPRELEVIRLVAAGDSNRAIAGTLSISERTVDRHVSNILTKLDLPSRSAATAYAYEHGLVRR